MQKNRSLGRLGDGGGGRRRMKRLKESDEGVLNTKRLREDGFG